MQLFFLLMILFLGINVIRLFRLRMGLAENISSGFMLGVGLTTFGLFLLGFVGYRFNFVGIFLFLLFGNLIFVLINLSLRNKYSLDLHLGFLKNLDKLDKFFFGGITFLFLTLLIRDLYWPIWMWDSIQMYDYRAKLIVQSQSIFFSAQSFYDAFYPLLTSLVHSILYVAGSNNPQYVYSFFFLALVLGVYSYISRLTSRKAALLISFIISFLPIFYRKFLNPETSTVFSIFILFGTFYLIRWMHKNDISYLILGSVFFAFSRFTRNEPLWLPISLLLFVVVLIGKHKSNIINLGKFRQILYILIFFLIPNYLVGVIFKKYLSIYNFPESLRFDSQFSFIGLFLQYIYGFKLKFVLDSFCLVFKYTIFDIVLPMIVIFFLGFRKHLVGETYYLFLVVFFYLLTLFVGTFFYRIIYFYSDSNFWALGTSLARFGMFWQVLVFVLGGLVLGECFSRINKEIR